MVFHIIAMFHHQKLPTNHQKLPTKICQKLLGTPKTQKTPFPISIHIYFPKKTRDHLKYRKNRVPRVPELIINDLDPKNRVPIAYQSRTKPKNRVPDTPKTPKIPYD